MPEPTYDRKKLRRAMWCAPLIGAIGLLPFILQLNLSVLQFLGVIVVVVVLAYLAGLVFGAPGYLLLSRLGYARSPYLLAYAGLLVVLAPIVLDDIYAVLAFGPPTLLAAAAFCYLRGSALASAEGADA